MANATQTPLEIALELIGKGYSPIPLPRGEKAPKIREWQRLRITAATAHEFFNGQPQNFGVLLGEPSQWLIDIDLDHPRAVELAAQYLPVTRTIFGRKSKRRSHWLYRVTEPTPTKKFSSKSSGMICELRSTNTQTVFPKSRHPSGELVEWDEDGEPAEIDPEELLQAVSRLADAVLVELGEKAKPRRPRTSPVQGGRAEIGTIERARNYVAKCPPSISGQGGHHAAITVAGHLVRGFDLSLDDAMQLLCEWNADCQPPWSETELSHKLNDADKHAGERGYLLSGTRMTNAASFYGSEEPPQDFDQEPTNSDENAKRLAAEDFTDLANARRAHRMYGEDLRYVCEWGKWLAWDTKRYAVDQQRAMDCLGKAVADYRWQDAARLVRKGMGDLAEDAIKFAKYSASATGVSNLLALLRSEPNVPVGIGALDSDPWLLNLQNGTLNLKTCELQPHRRADLLTKIMPFKYDAGANCPTWLRFIREITCDDTELANYLCRAVGASLVGVVRDHALFFCYGHGANGKSVFLNSIMALLGIDYAMKAPPDLLLARKGESHPTERADLFGKRFVACIETEDGRRMAESLVKELTGGDAIRARRMREDFWQFRPSHKLWLASNHKPTIRGNDAGIWRRIRLIPFNATFTPDQQDRELPEKLLNELPGILNWAVVGCAQWQERGLDEPACVLQGTNDYRVQMDTVGNFISDCCLIDARASVSATIIYRAYVTWCENNGEHAMTQKRFGLQLSERGIGQGRDVPGRTIRLGIGLLSEPSEGSNANSA
jgi:P4 family phage/plasmid primase-like protien